VGDCWGTPWGLQQRITQTLVCLPHFSTLLDCPIDPNFTNGMQWREAPDDGFMAGSISVQKTTDEIDILKSVIFVDSKTSVRFKCHKFLIHLTLYKSS